MVLTFKVIYFLTACVIITLVFVISDVELLEIFALNGIISPGT